ncbi:MAG TPA: antibiotic ABC transporter ATP-binding protein [Algoriphagus sp.]|uniref:ABC transporter ATP-binding protein n=2 Tax=Algoriphagus TaxID=246875 RepID=UPI000C5A138B|nr:MULTISPECIES: ABC transporter ATP-binding protein [unclassified Algoriphagus]MAL12434.1 antibiotic ABC transporter ATP-binding protein [Algoriphagus sp.]HAS58780.1 antibiotic ABC transporter ATP-binding protein [Algoriphagus sp.]HCD89857.1 antibiotic ABC transporter ATP-binding protein [Algoriphagus sp.]
MSLQKEKESSGEIVDTKVLRQLYQYVKPYKAQFYFLVFLTITLALLAPTRPYFIQVAIDDYVAIGDSQGLIRMIYILVGLMILQAIVQWAQTYYSGWIGQVIIRDLRVRLYNHLLKLKLKFFDTTPIGRLVTRNISDIETLADVFSEGLAAIIGDLLQLVTILGVMFYIDWKLTLVSLCTLPLMIISTYIFKEKIKVTFNDVRNAVSNLNSFLQEHITGMNIVQIFNREDREFEKFKEINREHRRAHIRSVLYYSIYFPVAEIIQAIGIGLVVWYGAVGVLGMELQIGVLISFIMYLQLFFRPIRMIADRFNTLQMGVVSSSRIFKLLDSKEHIANEGNFNPEKVKGDIQVKDLWFAYVDEDYVLKNINFEVKPGQTVALVGATGAGKSSIINLLSRFYEINKGSITIDGTDIREFELSTLRKHIGVVLQDVFLFSNTIYYNITLGNPNISREQVMEAAEMVGAKKFIERLPGGLDYNVMERGATLSVGQRQLISFVRAMVYNPEIIILDEATSSVDTETEELIQESIERMMKGRTSIVIAHRLSTIQKADKIIVLHKGEIVEQGTHDSLLNQGGYYTQLHQMQLKTMAI